MGTISRNLYLFLANSPKFKRLWQSRMGRFVIKMALIVTNPSQWRNIDRKVDEYSSGRKEA